MSASIGALQPWLQPYAQAAANYAAMYGGRVSSTYRSYSEQLHLWNNRAHNPFPVAPPGRSHHELGRAFDITAPPEVLAALARWWKSIGGTYYEADPIHFQA